MHFHTGEKIIINSHRPKSGNLLCSISVNLETKKLDGEEIYPWDHCGKSLGTTKGHTDNFGHIQSVIGIVLRSSL